MQQRLDELFASLPQPRILEAGCGSGTGIKMPAGAHITGIDISREELDKNTIVTEKIVGDLQTHELPDEHFDLIVCWDVLEHLPTPEEAIKRMIKALKTGGLLLLAFPNVYSVKALVAKATPHWFHERLYKYTYGPKYGRPGVITFPTYLRWSLAPTHIRELAEAHQLSVEMCRTYESAVQRRFRARLRVSDRAVRVGERTLELLSAGLLTLTGSDCIFIFSKRCGDQRLGSIQHTAEWRTHNRLLTK